MHPAEEFEVFRDLVVERGRSHEAVATRFGVTVRRVEQRLKLASLSPVILEAWRDGALVQAQVEAFALSDDHERQREAAAERERQEAEQAAEQAAEMKGDLSAALVSTLTLERRAGLRAAVATWSDLALRLVAYQSALRIRHWPRDQAPVIGIELRSTGLGAHEDGLAARLFSEQRERIAANLPDEPLALWDQVMAAERVALFAILAIGVAGTLDAHVPGLQEGYRAKRVLADPIAEAAGLDMRQFWQVDEAFLARVTKGVILEALREAAPACDFAPLSLDDPNHPPNDRLTLAMPSLRKGSVCR